MTVVGQLMALALAAMAREEVVFDYAWRHQLGEVPPSGSSVPVEAAAGFNDSAWSLVDTLTICSSMGNPFAQQRSHSRISRPRHWLISQACYAAIAHRSEKIRPCGSVWFEGASKAATLDAPCWLHIVRRAPQRDRCVWRLKCDRHPRRRLDRDGNTGWWYEGGGLTL